MSPISTTHQVQAIHATQPTTRRVDIAQRFDFTGSAGEAMIQSAIVQREMGKKGISNDYVNFVNALSSQVVRTQMAMQTIKTYAASAEAASERLLTSKGSDSRINTDLASSPNDVTAAIAQQPAEEPPLAATPDASSTAERIASAYNAAGPTTPTTQRFEAYA